MYSMTANRYLIAMVCAGLCCAGLGSTGWAAAKKKAKLPKVQPKHTIAVFVVAKDKPNAKILKALRAQLVPKPVALPAGRLVTGKALQKSLKTNPDKAISKCGPKMDCIAKLGKKAKADKILYARVVPAEKGIAVQCLIIDVPTAAKERGLAFEITDKAQAKGIVNLQLADMFPDAAQIAVAEAPVEPQKTTDDLLAMGNEPAATNAANPTPTAAPSESTGAATPTSEAGPGLDLSAISPAAESTPTPAEGSTPSTASATATEPTPAPASATTTEPAPAPGSGLVAAVAAMDQNPTPPSPPPSGSRLWRYVGTGVLGAGALAAGAGGLFGMQSSSAKNAIKTGANGTPQVQAAKKLNDANALASRANLFFGIGGVAAAAGAAIFAVDLFSSNDSGAATHVVVGTHGAGASLLWRF
jgi:hypothetical protein